MFISLPLKSMLTTQVISQYDSLLLFFLRPSFLTFIGGLLMSQLHPNTTIADTTICKVMIFFICTAYLPLEYYYRSILCQNFSCILQLNFAQILLLQILIASKYTISKLFFARCKLLFRLLNYQLSGANF